MVFVRLHQCRVHWSCFPFINMAVKSSVKNYLPKLASGEWLGCFGLTEPNHGSDPSGMLTNFRDAGDHVILNGAKMWISNAPFSQVAVNWETITREYEALFAELLRKR